MKFRTSGKSASKPKTSLLNERSVVIATESSFTSASPTCSENQLSAHASARKRPVVVIESAAFEQPAATRSAAERSVEERRRIETIRLKLC